MNLKIKPGKLLMLTCGDLFSTIMAMCDPHDFVGILMVHSYLLHFLRLCFVDIMHTDKKASFRKALRKNTKGDSAPFIVNMTDDELLLFVNDGLKSMPRYICIYLIDIS